MKKIIYNASEMGLEYVLICQDDHQFSAYYNREYFEMSIDEVIEKNAEVLCGGPSWFEDAFSSSDILFWVRRYSTPNYILKNKNFDLSRNHYSRNIHHLPLIPKS